MKTLTGYIKENYNVRDFMDNRKKVDRYTVEYQDENFNSYRKSYCFKPGTSFDEAKRLIPMVIP